MIGHDPPLFEKHCLELHHIPINKIVLCFTLARANCQQSFRDSIKNTISFCTECF